MKVSKKSVIQGLLFTAPIVLGSTIVISPSRAASLAFSTANLTLENFNRPGLVNPNFPVVRTVTVTSTDATDGTVSAIANASAIATLPPDPTRITQPSDARVEQFGRRSSGFALGSSISNLDFDTQDGLFRFDFAATLSASEQLTHSVPGVRAAATSFVGFQILDAADNQIDFFEANLVAGSPFTVRRSAFVQLTTDATSVSGFYARQFAAGTQLRVRGITLTSAAVTVPEPSMFAALLILPGLMGMKKVASSRDRQFD
ncbi:hypothetical protein [Leptolyngbya sp. NIES-2104]|uniref:hypothetical protein n=1 Tax=Leptolyngbya sp. NIES-2104 TaxID=1552121 RepID=UPI0006EC7DE9|nr:hypothetical protein [Leptolyngbya sp. NIES-2104]GAP96465.1 hypothetical protein NIES2104_30020 [Leptolyngbya sp. NIES-2104]